MQVKTYRVTDGYNGTATKPFNAVDYKEACQIGLRLTADKENFYEPIINYLQVFENGVWVFLF